MKAISLFLFACLLYLVSCSVFRRPAPLSYTARGCQLDSLKKQSAIIFQKHVRFRGYPKDQVFAHHVYEKDSVIIIQWFPVINDSLWGNGTIITISKKNCRVLEQEWFQ